MILTNDEAVRVLDSRLGALLRRKPIEIASVLELSRRLENGTELIAKGLVKSVRPVSLETYNKDAKLLVAHGFKSINGLKHHIINLYSPSLWESFKSGQVKFYRIAIDYTLETNKKSEDK